MSWKNESGNIAKNIRFLEWLKGELVESVGKLFKALIEGSEKLILDALTGILITVYLLAKRVGIDFDDLEAASIEKIDDQIEKGHEAESWYGDLSALKSYLDNQKR
ncbi:MazG-like family protein [Natranaerobius thermophilus]|uniref:MazG-like family protein n=1 Tax=Natranaerobius thermophilus (strain ATCC BAA-1301 / DSM 18059 / JW/NM-WN-LF) TaxID=457570 RepID=B2A453_NATTJ|nr:MazG-like family protein [Natranaerobius thermophilus]ACB86459.1 conserved hypothetical protein [Natranaerobius thermophilus JW/NM-WN-LF]